MLPKRSNCWWSLSVLAFVELDNSLDHNRYKRFQCLGSEVHQLILLASLKEMSTKHGVFSKKAFHKSEGKMQGKNIDYCVER